MKKSEMLMLLEQIEDDDDILIECDGGEYWGLYRDNLKGLVLTEPNNLAGHPGGKYFQTSAKVLLLKSE